MATSHESDGVDFERAAEQLGRTAEHVGRAAEELAERVARDARQFAERIASHATAFARDVAGEWQREPRDATRERDAGADIRRVFENVRAVVTEVIDGVDGLLSDLLPRATRDERDDDHHDEWTRAVLNRAAACEGCAAPLAAGDDGWVRRTAAGASFRCVACGAPGAS